MSVFARAPVTGEGATAAARSVLDRILETQTAAGVVVDVGVKGHAIPQRRLVRDRTQIDASLPFAPVILASGARLATQLTDRKATPDSPGSEKRSAAIVLRPCEARAAVELAKLRQVDLNQVLIIAVDCVGTHEVSDYADLQVSAEDWAQGYGRSLRLGDAQTELNQPYRSACSRCVDAVAPIADVWLHVIGVPEADGILVEIQDPGLADRLGFTETEDNVSRGEALKQLAARRQGKRQEELDAALGMLQPADDGTPGLVTQFDTCLRCLNCGTACPICYCKECLFRTDNVRVEPRHLLDLADRRGAVRLPGDAILYQLTRLMHVSTSCVGCGLCASACPMDLPVDLVFQAVARETQALLGYCPGADIAAPLPASSFLREEFEALGER